MNIQAVRYAASPRSDRLPTRKFDNIHKNSYIWINQTQTEMEENLDKNVGHSEPTQAETVGKESHAKSTDKKEHSPNQAERQGNNNRYANVILWAGSIMAIILIMYGITHDSRFNTWIIVVAILIVMSLIIIIMNRRNNKIIPNNMHLENNLKQDNFENKEYVQIDRISAMKNAPINSYQVNPTAENVVNVLANIILWIGCILSIIGVIYGLIMIGTDWLIGGYILIASLVVIIATIVQWAFLRVVVNISRNLYNINEALRQRK